MAYDLGLADRVRSLLTGQPGLSERRMFGGLAFLIEGHMCCGVRNMDLHLKLSPEDAAAALSQPHTRPLANSRGTSKTMIWVDCYGSDSDEDLERWVQLALRDHKKPRQ